MAALGRPARVLEVACGTGNPTIIEVEQRAKVGAEEIVTAAAKALEREFGPALVKLQFQEIVYLARKPKA
jgi:hypothetical protein